MRKAFVTLKYRQLRQVLRTDWTLFAFILGLIIAIAGPSFYWTFRGDEYPLIRRVDNALNQSGVFSLITTTQRGFQEAEYGWQEVAFNTDAYRPVLEILFLLERAIYGFWYPGYRLTNVAIILLSAMVVYWLAIRLIGCRRKAWLASFLFTIHFTHAHPFVGMLSNRTDSLVGLFVLSSVLLFAHYRSQETKQRFSAVVVAVALSLFSKETAIALPLILVAYDAVFTRPLQMHRLSIHACTFGLVGLYLAVRISLLQGIGETPLPVEWSLSGTLRNLVSVWVAGLLPRGYWPEFMPALRLRIVALVGALVLYLVWREVRPDLRRFQLWSFCLVTYYFAIGPALLTGAGGRFVYAATGFLSLCLADLLVSLLDRHRAGDPARWILRSTVAVAVGMFVVLSGFSELSALVRDGNQASSVANKIVRSLDSIAPHLAKNDKLFFVTIPAGCGRNASIFYNGLSDAVALRYGPDVRSFTLSQFSSIECDDWPSIEIESEGSNTFRVSLAGDPRGELLLSQTDIFHGGADGRLTNRYSQCTLEQTAMVSFRNPLGQMSTRPKAETLRIEIVSAILESSGQNHFLFSDGRQFWKLDQAGRWKPTAP